MGDTASGSSVLLLLMPPMPMLEEVLVLAVESKRPLELLPLWSGVGRSNCCDASAAAGLIPIREVGGEPTGFRLIWAGAAGIGGECGIRLRPVGVCLGDVCRPRIGDSKW